MRFQGRESVCRCACCHDSDDGSLEECVCGAKFHADCGPCPTIGCDDEEEYLRKLFAPRPVTSQTGWPWEYTYLGICGGCGRGRMPGPSGWSATKCIRCQEIEKSRAEQAKRDAFWDPICDLIEFVTFAVASIFACILCYYLYLGK